MAQLRSLGFGDGDAQDAVAITIAEGGHPNLEAALDWLCVHVPDPILPARFAAGNTHPALHVSLYIYLPTPRVFQKCELLEIPPLKTFNHILLTSARMVPLLTSPPILKGFLLQEQAVCPFRYYMQPKAKARAIMRGWLTLTC